MALTPKDECPPNTWMAILGRRDAPTDGIEDYCFFLGEALKRDGIDLRQTRVPWAEKGWFVALRSLWAESANWRGQWVLLQFTTMAWSRRGFPFGALAALAILRRSKLPCAVVFHDSYRQNGRRWIDRFRGACQDWVIRRLYARATKAIFLEPLDKIRWLPKRASKAVFIPIGANLPGTPPRESAQPTRNGNARTVAVFCLSDVPNLHRELDDIAHAMRFVAQQGIKARVVFAGRGTAEAKRQIDERFDLAAGQAANLGLRPAAELRRILSEADVMLCVRGPLYMRRGSAIAGIACGLPIVGYAGEAAGTPLEEAGVELVPYLDRDALGRALGRVLSEPERHKALSLRSWQTKEKWFSWDRIANSFVRAFRQRETPLNLLIYSYYWAPILGGVQTVTMALARGIASRSSDSIRVTVVTHTLGSGTDDSALPVRVFRRPGIIELLRLLSASDLVHLAGPALFPLLLARLLRKRVVIEHHGYQTICPNGLLIFGKGRTVCPGYFMSAKYHRCVQCQSSELGWARSLLNTVFTFLRRSLAKGARANVVPSRHIGNRVSLPRTELIYHGVPSKGPHDGMSSDGQGSPCFAFAGRLVPEKGVDLLLRAAYELSKTQKDFRVRIVGDGPERERLEQMSAELGLMPFVEFVGGVAADQVDRMLSCAEAVVMPSTWEDVAPLVAPEQMMQGRLVIASDIGGLGETVGTFGLKFPAGDVGALASCMKYAIGNRQAISGLREQARQHAIEVHAEARMIEEHAKLYRSVAR